MPVYGIFCERIERSQVKTAAEPPDRVTAGFSAIKSVRWRVRPGHTDYADEAPAKPRGLIVAPGEFGRCAVADGGRLSPLTCEKLTPACSNSAPDFSTRCVRRRRTPLPLIFGKLSTGVTGGELSAEESCNLRKIFNTVTIRDIHYITTIELLINFSISFCFYKISHPFRHGHGQTTGRQVTVWTFAHFSKVILKRLLRSGSVVIWSPRMTRNRD